MQDKIFALSTAVGKSAVAILRMSGEGTKAALKEIFQPFPDKPNYLKHGNLTIDGLTDTAMLVYFDAPKSYTGEEMAEIHLHGSMPLVRLVSEKLFGLGFRTANNGEFTKRAYVNGKTNLSKAEGLADLVNAESLAALRAAGILARGGLGDIADGLQNDLTDCLARLEAALDYPEEDLEGAEMPLVEEILTAAQEKIDGLLRTARQGKTAKFGARVAIVGDVNVGKSSLLNAIVGYDRAIVSSIKGTTRDTIEESIDFKGIKFTFIDTAGQRETEDEIEMIGVRRAKAAMEDADIILLVSDDDSSEPDWIKTSPVPTIFVKSKGDKDPTRQKADIVVSGKTGENVQQLLEMIFDALGGRQVMTAPVLLTNQRHEECLTSAQECIKEAKSMIRDGVTADLIAATIRQAWQYVGQITGNTDMQTVVDVIFSKFCLGK